MMFSRLAWGVWALVPVAVVTYHFGPGQSAYVLDRAAHLRNQAADAQVEAQMVQDAAYAKHLDAIEARRLAFVDPTAEHQSRALDASGAEERMYAKAAEAWKAAADRFQDVLATLGDASPKEACAIRWAKARADVRAGDIWTGIKDLEALVAELDAGLESDRPLARAAREELATAYYYGARLLRLSGMPVQEWRIESGKARQHFRYLAEHAASAAANGADGEPANTATNDVATGENGADGAPANDGMNYRRNLELVLNLEQSSLMDLQGKPLPKESPRVGKLGNRPGKRPGKARGPFQKDGRGAGRPEEIFEGW